MTAGFSWFVGAFGHFDKSMAHRRARRVHDLDCFALMIVLAGAELNGDLYRRRLCRAGIGNEDVRHRAGAYRHISAARTGAARRGPRLRRGRVRSVQDLDDDADGQGGPRIRRRRT